MLLALSFLTTAAGTACAAGAQRYPTKARLLRRCGGSLLVCGIALLGFSFPYI